MSALNIIPLTSKLFRAPEDAAGQSPITGRIKMGSAEGKMPSAVRFTMLGCSITALLISSYLAWASLTSSPIAGCGGGRVFDCESVLHSQWSSIGSIPVSIPAIATHIVIISMLVLGIFPSWRNYWQTALLGIACISSALAAIWFVGLQIFWIQHLCLYCMIAHVSGVTLATLFVLYQPIERKFFNRLVGVSTLMIAILILLQLQNSPPLSYEVIEYSEKSGELSSPTSEEPNLFESPELIPEPTLDSPLPDSQSPNSQSPNSQSTDSQASGFKSSYKDYKGISWDHVVTDIQLRGIQAINPFQYSSLLADDQPAAPSPRLAKILNDISLRTTSWPLIGSPDAELVFVELFDYTCPHCQQTHTAIEAARKKLGNRLAVMTLAVPLDMKCNSSVKSTSAVHASACELAKIAIAVWVTDKTKYEEFHNYLFASKPNGGQALAKAKSMVDPLALDNALKGSLPSSFVSKHVDLYKKAGGGTIPKLLFPKSTSSGAITSPETIIKLVETHLKNDR